MARKGTGKKNKLVTVEKLYDLQDAYGGLSEVTYPALNETTSVAEVGTTTTNIKITAHGLSSGDYITNDDRDDVVREVTVVDVDNFTVTAVTDQTSGDNIKLHKYANSKIWANFVNRRVPHIDENQKRKILVSNKLTTRYRSDMQKDYILSIGSRTFQILSFYDPDGTKYELEFDCEEIL